MRTHNNKKAKKSRPYYFKPLKVFIGTNIVPLGRLKAIRQAEANQLLNNYKDKVEKWKKDGKKGNKPELQKNELRIYFIEFTRSKRQILEKPTAHFERDFYNHQEQVVNYCERLQREWDNKSNYQKHSICRSSPVYIKTSKRIVCSD